MARTTQKQPSKPLLEEVAATGDGLNGISEALHGGISRPRDTRLMGDGGEAYRLMLRDDQVHSTFQQRRLAVIARDWSVTPGGEAPADKAAADHLSAQLSRIGWDRVTEKMLYGMFFGYAVAEILWKIEDGLVEIDAIKVRDRTRFLFDRERQLRLKTAADPDGKLMPPAKFWCFSSGADTDDDPYGIGLGYHLYWPVWFKREGLKSWLQGLDKTARPTAVGKFPAGASQDDIDKLLATLQAYASDTGVAIPDAMSIELMQAARSATTDYDTLYNRMDAAISKIVLSQTMTTDSSVSGLGSNQADVHADVKQEVVKADADLLDESFNATVARWLTAWNFPGATPPVVARQIDDAEDLDAASERDVRLTQIGWRPTEERIRETYGEGYERAPAGDGRQADIAGDGRQADITGDGRQPQNAPASDTPGRSGERPADPAFAACPSCGSAEFADKAREPDTVDHLVNSAIEDEAWVRQMEPMLAPLARSAADAGGIEDFRDGLIARLNEMDVSELQTTLAQSAFAARIAGRLGADREDADEIEDPSADFAAPKRRLVDRLFRLKKKP